jgi:hypothetical protein
MTHAKLIAGVQQGRPAAVFTAQSPFEEKTMRFIRLLLPALAIAAMFVPPESQADPYKWCAQYGGRGGGGRNCGFVTWEQCMATVSGIGGFCEPNQFYTGPEPQRRKARKRTRD